MGDAFPELADDLRRAEGGGVETGEPLDRPVVANAQYADGDGNLVADRQEVGAVARALARRDELDRWGILGPR